MPRSCNHCHSIVRSRGGTEIVDIAAAGPPRRSEVVFAVLVVAGKGGSPMRSERAAVEAQSCWVRSLVVGVLEVVHSGLRLDAVFGIGC